MFLNMLCSSLMRWSIRNKFWEELKDFDAWLYYTDLGLLGDILRLIQTFLVAIIVVGLFRFFS